jgi:hypothetical protein
MAALPLPPPHRVVELRDVDTFRCAVGDSAISLPRRWRRSHGEERPISYVGACGWWGVDEGLSVSLAILSTFPPTEKGADHVG